MRYVFLAGVDTCDRRMQRTGTALKKGDWVEDILLGDDPVHDDTRDVLNRECLAVYSMIFIFMPFSRIFSARHSI